mmetsp:Transcript_56808/g.151613  ORF Transcript_56808/g.151613 Transcript_56808/m.151613 type:complete len:223 (-) Transcript_56808:952-1620(-)
MSPCRAGGSSSSTTPLFVGMDRGFRGVALGGGRVSIGAAVCIASAPGGRPAPGRRRMHLADPTSRTTAHRLQLGIAASCLTISLPFTTTAHPQLPTSSPTVSPRLNLPLSHADCTVSVCSSPIRGSASRLRRNLPDPPISHPSKTPDLTERGSVALMPRNSPVCFPVELQSSTTHSKYRSEDPTLLVVFVAGWVDRGKSPNKSPAVVEARGVSERRKATVKS